jgi:hypothetical protein
MYVECTVSQTMEHFLACHQHALEFFGGIPHTVMVANRTSAVLKRAVGEAPVLTPTYLDCATHHGVSIAPCNVGKGNAKGRVENGVGSVKKNSLAGLDMPDFSARNPAARHGLDTVAHVRLHGATRDTPTALWHTERAARRPLPLHPFDIGTVSQVRAMDDALVYEAFSSEYIANLLAQRARCPPEASALPLPRRADLLQGSLAPPDLSIAQVPPQPPNT